MSTIVEFYWILSLQTLLQLSVVFENPNDVEYPGWHALGDYI